MSIIKCKIKIKLNLCLIFRKDNNEITCLSPYVVYPIGYENKVHASKILTEQIIRDSLVIKQMLSLALCALRDSLRLTSWTSKEECGFCGTHVLFTLSLSHPPSKRYTCVSK